MVACIRPFWYTETRLCHSPVQGLLCLSPWNLSDVAGTQADVLQWSVYNRRDVPHKCSAPGFTLYESHGFGSPLNGIDQYEMSQHFQFRVGTANTGTTLHGVTIGSTDANYTD
jgi:hypothetical protein